jgi:hypothetical protein
MTQPDHADALADWSLWLPFVEAVAAAPRLPGVYMAKDSAQVVYVGMAAERRGQGIRGRLTVYRRGRAAVSGGGAASLNCLPGGMGIMRPRRMADGRELR